jgi:plasmid stability protein
MVLKEIHNGTDRLNIGAIMPVNLSIKNVPDALAAKLRERAGRNHRSLQGELMAILEVASAGPQLVRANAVGAPYEAAPAAPPADSLLQRLTAIAGDRGIDTTRRLTREQAHDRKLLRKAGV